MTQQGIHVTVALFLQVCGTVLFVLAGLGIPEAPRFRFIGWGLALWGLSFLLPY
jgi:hypothetical protein